MMDLKLIETSGLGKKNKQDLKMVMQDDDSTEQCSLGHCWGKQVTGGSWKLFVLLKGKKKNSWWAVKKMFALSRAAAEMLAVAACLRVGCLRSTGL